jgi:Lon protease-like protein
MPEESRELALFPLNTVLFPGMPLPLHIFEDRYRLMIDECLETEEDFGVLLARPELSGANAGEAHRIGTSARITHVHRLDDGRMNILTTGQARFRVLQLVRKKPYLMGRIESFPLEAVESDQVAGLTKQVSALFVEYMKLVREVLGDLIQIESTPRDAVGLAFLVAKAIRLSLEEKQQLLVLRTLPKLLQTEHAILGRERALLQRLRQIQESETGYVHGATGHFSLS